MYGGYSLPLSATHPGEQLTVLVAIEGRINMYIATATDTAGGFVIEDQQQHCGGHDAGASSLDGDPWGKFGATISVEVVRGV